MATAMQRYWRNQGITAEQREAVVREQGTDPTNDPDVSVDNTVATETDSQGNVEQTVSVEPDAGAQAVAEADTSDLPAYATSTGFLEDGSDSASSSEDAEPPEPSDGSEPMNDTTNTGSEQTPLPSLSDAVSDPKLVALAVAVAGAIALGLWWL